MCHYGIIKLIRSKIRQIPISAQKAKGVFRDGGIKGNRKEGN